MGRPTLREALRFLEALGILDVRPGKRGGAYVVRPSEATLGETLSRLIELRGVSPQDLAEFRLSFEADNAWWAAKRATKEDIACLDNLVVEAAGAARSHGDWSHVGKVDACWHAELARSTRSSLRLGISGGIHEALLRNHEAVMRSVRASGPKLDGYVRGIVRDMTQVTSAVAEREAEVAAEMMRAHVQRGNRLNAEIFVG